MNDRTRGIPTAQVADDASVSGEYTGLPLAGRSRAAPRRPRHRGLDDFEPATDDRRRVAASGRCLH
jgi:hypothetical protein